MWGLVRISDIMKGGNDLSIVYTYTKLPKRGKLTREGTCLDWKTGEQGQLQTETAKNPQN